MWPAGSWNWTGGRASPLRATTTSGWKPRPSVWRQAPTFRASASQIPELASMANMAGRKALSQTMVLHEGYRDRRQCLRKVGNSSLPAGGSQQAIESEQGHPGGAGVGEEQRQGPAEEGEGPPALVRGSHPAGDIPPVHCQIIVESNA